MYNIVDNAVIVIAKVSGEYRVLDSGSILVFEDRQLLGEVSLKERVDQSAEEWGE